MDTPDSLITRRRFLADTAPAAVGTLAVGHLIASRSSLNAAEPASSVTRSWAGEPDRTWLGADVWANPMQDWQTANGRIECTKAAPDRNVHSLTHQLGGQEGTLEMSVKAGRSSGKKLSAGKGSLGFRLGILGTLRNYPEYHDYRNNLWPSGGAGFHAGISADGQIFLGDFRNASPLDGTLDFETAEFRLKLVPTDDTYSVTLEVLNAENGEKVGEATQNNVTAESVVGNLALVNNYGSAGRNAAKNNPKFGMGQFWFNDWSISGTKVTGGENQRFGPILFSQYTVSSDTLKLTAQMPPLGAEDHQDARLEVQKDGEWHAISIENIHPQARTATFRYDGWKSDADVPYRVAYTLKGAGGDQDHYWEGVIRRDPVDQEELTVGDVSCNIHTIFPNVMLVNNMTALNPDMLAFTGDQFYESCGGYGTQRSPMEPALVDYLRKWYFHGWTWRELTKDRPSVSLPDDHDVYQGNIWGENGAAQQGSQESGGYNLPSEWVNVVHITQTSHHPDPYDPTPGKRGTTNWYGEMNWGRISFAIIADRQYKTGPEGEVPPTGSRPDHVISEGFDPSGSDLPGLELLGETQMDFLRKWASDWTQADMKSVISQTVFTSMATTHGRDDMILYADYDSNGWPQSKRDEALREIRKAFAFHMAGDQHLPAVVHYGIDEARDAGVAFAGPAVNVGYPRKWEPVRTGRNKKTGTEGLIGDFHDHFDNPMAVLAVNNMPAELPSDVLEQLIAKTSGLGTVTFNRKKRTVTIRCWAYDADPTEEGTQFPGWPIVVNQMDNYGRKPVAWLPEIKVKGLKNPVVQVTEEATGDTIYALRINGSSFQPHTFSEGLHTVRVFEPGTTTSDHLQHLEATSSRSEESVNVDFT